MAQKAKKTGRATRAVVILDLLVFWRNVQHFDEYYNEIYQKVTFLNIVYIHVMGT